MWLYDLVDSFMLYVQHVSDLIDTYMWVNFNYPLDTIAISLNNAGYWTFNTRIIQ